MQTALCDHCGGPNPPGTTVCQWCAATLPSPTLPVADLGGYRPLDATPGLDRGSLAPLPTTSPGLYYRVAIPLIIFGVILLGISAAIAQGVASFNQGCVKIPGCTPESDPSGGVAALAVALIVIAVALIAYGASRGSSREGQVDRGES